MVTSDFNNDIEWKGADYYKNMRTFDRKQVEPLTESEIKELNAIVQKKMEECFPDSPYLKGALYKVVYKTRPIAKKAKIKKTARKRKIQKKARKC